jgi:hypothetical protein
MKKGKTWKAKQKKTKTGTGWKKAKSVTKKKW